MRASGVLEEELSQARATQARIARSAMLQAIHAQEEWIFSVMKKLMPPKVYKTFCDRSGTMEQFEKRQQVVKDWQTKNDIRVVKSGFTQQVFRAGKLISTFRVKVVDKAADQ